MTVTDEAVEAAMDAWWGSPSWERELADGMRAALGAALPHLALSLYCPSVRASVGKWRDDLEAKVAERDAEIVRLMAAFASLETQYWNSLTERVERDAEIFDLTRFLAKRTAQINASDARIKALEDAILGVVVTRSTNTSRMDDAINTANAVRAALKQAP